MRAKTFSTVGILALVVLVAVGLWAYVQQIHQGDVVTGMRTIGAGGIVWGLYIVMDGFFLGAGIVAMLAACLARLVGGRRLEPVARIAMPVAITCFLGAALCVMADQGRPLAALRALAFFARPQSPMFVTFTTVTAVCLFGSLVHCVLARRPDLADYAKQKTFWQPLQRLLAAGYSGSASEQYRRAKSGFWMSLFMVPALLAPLSALAVMFTVRAARPVSSTVLEIVAFVLISGAAGIALLLVAARLVEAGAGQVAGMGHFAMARLGAALLFVLALALTASIAAETVGLYADEPALVDTSRAMLSGAEGVIFWSQLVCFFGAALVLYWEARRGFGRNRRIVVAALAALVGAFAHHYLQLTVWQTHGLSLPYEAGSYTPTLVEVLVAVGVVAFSLLALIPAVRLIPFAPVASDAECSVSRPSADPRRLAITLSWAAGGSVAATLGLVLSGRAGTDASQDPIVAGSPVLFALGLCVLVTTGAVYELLPERE